MRLKLPEDISTAEGISHALAAILASAAQGEITIGEALQLSSLLELRRKMIERIALRVHQRVAIKREIGVQVARVPNCFFAHVLQPQKGGLTLLHLLPSRST